MSGWSDEPSSATAQAPDPATTGWSDDPNPAQESVKLSSGITPDTAAQVLHLSDKTGLPTDFVSRNADALQTQADNAAITPQFSQNHPVTTAYVGENPHQAAVAGSDIPVLGAVERQFKYMANQTERGGLDVERQFRGMLKAFGYQDGGNDQRISDIEDRLQGDLNMQAPGPISNVLGKVAESAPILGGGLAIGAAATAASLPAAVAAGGTAAAFGALEFGNAFLDFSKRKDAVGNPAMTADEARGFSLISGALNGAMFMVPAEKMLSKMPGLRMLTGEGLRSLISSPSALGALRTVAADIGKTGLAMGGFSGMSTLVHSVAGHLGEIKGGSVQPASVSEFISTLFPSEDLKAAASSAASGAVTGGVIGATEGGVGAGLDFRNYTKSMEAKDVYYAQRYKQAQETAQGWNNIGSALQGTKMAEIAPGQVDKLVSRMAPDSHVYIPMEHWQSYWEGQKADPRAAYLAAVGDTKSYDESMRTGADLQVPAGKYASSIAASDHGEFFNNVLRADPLAMSAEDAKQSLGLTKEIEKEKKDAANKIKDSVIPPPLPEPETEPITPAPDIHTKEAQMVQGQEPLFVSPRAEGMSDDMAGKYRQAIDEARGKAQEDITRQIVDKELRQKSSAWLEERSEVQAQVEKETKQRPEYQAIEALQSNTDVANNFGVKTFKLDKKIVEEMDPTGSTKSYPIGMMAESGGLHPDDAAHIFGFNSGSELLYNLKTSPKFDDVVREETDRQMMARHPEISNDNIMDRAMEAVHSTERSKVLRLELQHLASDDFAAFKGLSRKIARRVPTTEEVRSDAEQTIGQKIVGDTAPLLYQRAESIASREAQEHFLRGDFEKAFEAKLQELRNHELYRAAKNAKEQTAKDVAYAQKFDRDSIRARIGKAGADYLKQIDAIRDAFDFSKITGTELQSRQSLRDWVQSQKDAGYNPVVPEDLLDQAGRKSWRELTNDELRTTTDSMRNISHLAGLKNKLLAAKEERTFDETRDKIVGTLADRFELTPEKLRSPLEENPSLGMKIKTGMNVAGAWLTRFEPLFRMVGLHDEFYEGINNAEDSKTSGMRDFHSKLVDMLSDYTKQERAQFGRTTYIPELEGTLLSPNRSHISILMSLLHAGNEGNLRELMRGYELNEDHLAAMWKTLTPKDLELAQNVWDFIGSYKDSIGKQERELNGIEPEWIEGRPVPVTLADGSKHNLNGGYFPLVYDKNVSFRTAALGSDALQDLFKGYQSNTATKHNWTQARVGGGGQAPSLNWSVFTNHVSDVIHDLAYRKPVIDLHRLINDDAIRSNLQAGLGKGVYGELNPWLKRIAGDRQWTPLGPLEALRTLSNNMTFAELGIKVGSAMVHMTSILPAARETSLGYMAQGFKTFLEPEKATKFMWDNSEFMKSRWDDAGDRDIRNAEATPHILNTQKGFWNELKAMSPIQQKDAFILMRAADISIAGPTWYAGYYKAMDGKVKNIDAHDHESAVGYADQLVRDTKGAGAAKDLAPYQTYGGSVGKLFTMFQTQLNVIANQMMNVARQGKIDRDWGKVAGGVMATWIGPAIGAQLLRGHFPSSDDGWLKWGLKATAEFPFEVNPMTQPFIRFLEHPEDKLTLLPVEEALGTVAKTGLTVLNKNPITDHLTDNQTEWTKKDYEDAFMTLGYLKGIPTRQIMQSTLRLNGWMSGEEPHDNPLGGIYSVATGAKPRE